MQSFFNSESILSMSPLVFAISETTKLAYSCFFSALQAIGLNDYVLTCFLFQVNLFLLILLKYSTLIGESIIGEHSFDSSSSFHSRILSSISLYSS